MRFIGVTQTGLVNALGEVNLMYGDNIIFNRCDFIKRGAMGARSGRLHCRVRSSQGPGHGRSVKFRGWADNQQWGGRRLRRRLAGTFTATSWTPWRRYHGEMPRWSLGCAAVGVALSLTMTGRTPGSATPTAGRGRVRCATAEGGSDDARRSSGARLGSGGRR